MEVKVLGSGCSSCEKLYRTVLDVVRETGVEATVSKVTDLKEILGYGIMATPGVVIDGVVKASGRVPSRQEIVRWLQER